MRKVLLVTVILGILSLTVACMPPASTTTTTTPIATLTTDVATLKTDLATKANKTEVAAVLDTVNKLQGTVTTLGGQVAALPQAQNTGYTKAETDAAIAKAINDYKATITIGTTTTTGTTVTTSPTGTVTWTMNPTSIPPVYTGVGGGTPIYYTVHVVNNNSQWQYIKPIININIASGYSAVPGLNSLSINISCGQGNINQSYSWNGTTAIFTPTPGQISLAPVGVGYTPATAIPSLVCLPVGGGLNGSGEFQLGAGQTMDLLISISNFATTSTVMWNINTSISSRNMY